MINIPTKKLNEKAYIPILGLGTYNLLDKELYNTLDDAFEIGYRHIDTADFYHNHEGIGEFIKNGGYKRDDIFLTTKVWKTDLAPDILKGNTKRFLEELKTDYIDLLLIHAPNDEVAISDTLAAMKELKEKGIVNAIGVSNFNIQQMQIVLDVQQHWSTEFKVVNNQIEYNPTNQVEGLLNYCHDNGVSVTAYSPLNKGKDITSKTVIQLAHKYDKTAAQIILKWLIQKGMIVIPKTSDHDHLNENANIFEWSLDEDDINKMDDPSIIIGENR